MNLSINQLVPWLVVPLGLAFAVWAGGAVAEGQTMILLAVLGGVLGLTLVLGTGRSIWLLIPLCWPLVGSIAVLPLPFSVQELAVFAAFGAFCAQVAMKQFKGILKPPADYLDLFITLNLLIIVAMFLRNPVGFAVLGGETVGGRPYLKVATGLMALIVLSRCIATPRLAYLLPAVLLIPSAIVSALGVITYVFPQTAPVIAPFYTGITVSSYMEQAFGTGGAVAPTTLAEGRFQTLATLGLAGITALVAYNSPSKLLGVFGRPALFVFLTLSFFFIGMAGFRNYLFQGGFFLLLAAYFWEKGIGVFRIATLGVVGVALAIAVQTVTPLPNSIQRSLSFIPGPWDERVKDGSKESTDWRVEMWQIALTTDRYIQNKVLGDGFGFTAKELEIMKSADFGGTGFIGGEAHKENFMVTGSYHSGPVSSIRFAGYVGLVAIVMLQIALAFYAVKMMRLAWNTEYRPLAILLALGAVYSPLLFIFIFGEYRNDLPNALFTAGMLKMLHNSLRANAHVSKNADEPNELPLTRNTSLAPRPALAGVRYAR
jgi:hypothetical protein